MVVCAPESILIGTLVIGGVAWELAKILVVKFMQALDRSLSRKPTLFDTFSKLALLILKSVEFSVHHSLDMAQLPIIRTIHLLHPLLLLFYNDHGFYRIIYWLKILRVLNLSKRCSSPFEVVRIIMSGLLT